ncbi:acyl-[acyl-carrier-protein]-phospholipid O-acyltransferase / long-chain-fatty-acid--[acyl-carrier-protein] ligase [Aliiroseovarius crassostreae]|uniref:Phospholipid/glycerol acyltransferase domain-containing protein n=1 Tax=Aliiroseovarius crassostreae TaxID=154981 RepID=A0A0P7J4Y7_9RHOB|nr:lysophospholipid acyltransferase family protein [Aliiroseovarius crassostreae]KPN62900.1 hypothetical protein AKJ29_01780 [Aliiroseovarius crassostreae]SFU98588.1 acyl-[acyl-carrier-protein]-phospholipid O-acyltransferase / long-chain-fatty-acid--[acyl-carrier-protein] ligase [Aliiroseovarius crassostreae]
MTRIALWRRWALSVLRVEVVYRPATLAKLREGRALLVCNHQSFLDGIIVALASPERLCFPISNRQSREIRFTRYGLIVLGLVGLGEQVAMNGNHPFGIRALAKKLEDGDSVAIFPQGRIVGPSETQEWMPGYQWLASRSEASIVSISISGADQSKLFAPEGDRLWPKIRLEF